ncbi:MAG: SIMPL domain-containing protein [Candidatus Buchananbacteria bacterium]|nr:SIMPL domain-containing protein [Candidatus Buchananbacteria bacterium]
MDTNIEKKVLKIKPPVWGLVLATIIVVLLVIFLGALTRNELKKYDYIGRSDEKTYTITIDGEGKVTAIPDIAQVSLGIQTDNAKVEIAQKENSEKMNNLIKEVKALGVEDKDIKTVGYNIYPRYDYTDGRSILRGYQVSQSVVVKIRDLEKIGDMLDMAGRVGANQVSGVNFDIDEPEVLRQEAREKALANAKEKAESLAKVAGVKLGKLVSFNESANGYPVYARSYAMLDEAAGLAKEAAAPAIEAGSQEIIVNVTVTYEVL